MNRIHLIGLIANILLSQATAQVYLGDYTGHAVDGRAITVEADSYAVRFVFYRPGILRADFLPTPETIPDSSFVVVQDTSQAVYASITETDSILSIASPSLTIRCTKYPLRFSYYDAGGQLLIAEPSSGGVATDDPARIANFDLDPAEHFYGTGERGIGLDLRGSAFDSYNTQAYGYGGALPTMNINIPFLASSRGYALFFDNTYKGRFDLGSVNPSQFSYRAFGGELTFYLIAGETIADQLEQYTWLSGRQPMPPRWALGYIQSKFGYQNETEARTMVETMRAKEIPCDAIVIDLYWFNEMGDITWYAPSWPSPFQMMSDFRAIGFKTIVITEPYIVTRSLNFGEAIAGGYLGFNSSGNPYILPNWWSCGCDVGLLDITDPGARSWWWGKHPAFFGNELAAIWTDLGEPESHPVDMHHELGPAPKVHNIYNLLWAETLFNGFNDLRPNQRLFNLTRSGFAGMQRYGAATWSGDVAKSFNSFAVQVPMLLNAGMSGIGYHHSDIGGFCCGTTTPELYVRWMQYGTLGPIARAHGAGPAVGGQNTEPWTFGQTAEDISREFIRLRYQLLPYIYNLARENHETGMPLARPLFFHDPNDLGLSNHTTSYMLGEALLVSPIVDAGQTSQDVYLPSGTWFDFWNDEVHSGHQNVNVLTPLETIPVFVKAGSIIPRQPVMNYTDEYPLDTLLLSIYPSQNEDASLGLYEDDGETLEYQTGSYAMTEFVQTTKATSSLMTITIGPTLGVYSGKPANRVYLADVHGIPAGPTAMRKNGVSVFEKFSYDELRGGGDGYFYDSALDILFVHIPTVPDSSYELVAEGILLAVSDSDGGIPLEFVLEQNYPNPFNGISNFGFRLPARRVPTGQPTRRVVDESSTRGQAGISDFTKVDLRVFDLLGREVATIVDERLSPGTYTRRWDATGMPSGVYFYRLSTSGFVQTRKLVLLR